MAVNIVYDCDELIGQQFNVTSIRFLFPFTLAAHLQLDPFFVLFFIFLFNGEGG